MQHWSVTLLRRLIGIGFWATFALALLAVREAPSHYEQIQEKGVLRVAVINSPTVYYQDPNGNPTGFEYELATSFAKFLGVELQVVETDYVDLLPNLNAGNIDLVAAGLSITPERLANVRFSPSYQEIKQQLVYKRKKGERRPRKLSSLYGQTLEVASGSNHAERLRELQREHDGLRWTESVDQHANGLMRRVSEGELKYTIADSHLVALNQGYYPNLRVGFDIGKPEKLAWAFRRSKDNSLYNASIQFFQRAKTDRTIENLDERFYGHVKFRKYVGVRTFNRQIRERLPKFEGMFKKHAKIVGMDWRLLAAMGYQESHWDPDAESPTKVRGIMMLTTPTARSVGITDREDAEQSIKGGARYFMKLYRSLPDSVPDPDRFWMTVACYNMGPKHLYDARKIAKQKGLNPNSWKDVRNNIPLLAERQWYRKASSGFARGPEAVQYVDNIRNYYDILVRVTNERERKSTTPVKPNKTPEKTPDNPAPGEDIISPVL